MADNVHYFGRTDTVPGVCVGNGFGVQFDDGATDPPGYPIVVPFDDCIKWFWRIKIWKITTDATASSTSTMASITLPSDNLDDAFMRTEELELVQPDVYINQSESFDPSPGNTAFVEIALFAGNPVFSLLSPNVALVSGDYKPALVIDGTMTIDDATVEFSSRSDRFSPPSGDFMATVDGQDVTIYYLLATAAAAFVCTQMDFEAADDGTGYWPYQGTNGMPIYSTVTGVALQSPRN